jgi:hypothetical protein
VSEWALGSELALESGSELELELGPESELEWVLASESVLGSELG